MRSFDEQEQFRRFDDGVYTQPSRCPTDGCRGKSFAPNRGTAVSVDWRRLRLQVHVSSSRYSMSAVSF